MFSLRWHHIFGIDALVLRRKNTVVPSTITLQPQLVHDSHPTRSQSACYCRVPVGPNIAFRRGNPIGILSANFSNHEGAFYFHLFSSDRYIKILALFINDYVHRRALGVCCQIIASHPITACITRYLCAWKAGLSGEAAIRRTASQS